MVMDLTIRQALDVWSDLEAAYYGKNKFGGDTAEIYAYRLQQRNPTAEASMTGFVKSGFFKESVSEQARLAGRNLLALLALFKKTHECRIILSSRRAELRRDGLWHRCHVKIVPKVKS
jgi:hypothetical protein